jgi:hypothetical protein
MNQIFTIYETIDYIANLKVAPFMLKEKTTTAHDRARDGALLLR